MILANKHKKKTYVFLNAFSLKPSKKLRFSYVFLGFWDAPTKKILLGGAEGILLGGKSYAKLMTWSKNAKKHVFPAFSPYSIEKA